MFRFSLRQFKTIDSEAQYGWFFTERPTSLLATITPNNVGVDRKVVSSDLVIEPNHPMPVLRIPFPNWPPTSKSATVNLELGYREITSQRSDPFDVALLQAQESRHLATFGECKYAISRIERPAKGIAEPHVRIRVRAKIAEPARAEAPRPGMDRIELEPRPDYVGHRSAAEPDVLEHEFIYLRQPEELKTVTLVVTPASAQGGNLPQEPEQPPERAVVSFTEVLVPER